MKSLHFDIAVIYGTDKPYQELNETKHNEYLLRVTDEHKENSDDFSACVLNYNGKHILSDDDVVISTMLDNIIESIKNNPPHTYAQLDILTARILKYHVTCDK